MDKNIMKKTGFQKEVDLADQGRCPFCKVLIDVNLFVDELSKKEFAISGLCQKCQDETFGGKK